MAILYSAAAAATLATLTTRVRRFVQDTDTDTANQRWADAEIYDSINLELMKMGAALRIRDKGPALTSVNLTYTASSETVALPNGPKSQPIFKVEDITTSSYPVPMTRISAEDLEAHNYDPATSYNASSALYAIMGDNIAVRPKPGAARTLRIWYIRAPYVLSVSTDQHPIDVGSEELISVGAGCRLLRNEKELEPEHDAHYRELWMQFLMSASRFQGSNVIKRNRRWE